MNLIVSEINYRLIKGKNFVTVQCLDNNDILMCSTHNEEDCNDQEVYKNKNVKG